MSDHNIEATDAALDYVIRDLEVRAGTSGVVEIGQGAYLQAKGALEAYKAKVSPKADQHGDCLCCCRKHGGRGFTQGCVKCEQERTAAQAQEGK